MSLPPGSCHLVPQQLIKPWEARCCLSEPQLHLPRLYCLSHRPCGPLNQGTTACWLAWSWRADGETCCPTPRHGVAPRVPVPAQGGGGGRGLQPKPPQQLSPAKGQPVHTRSLLGEHAACQITSPTPRCNLGVFFNLEM